ncbi:hypothetical protein OYT88_00990 [Sporolactobacillus sp. CQH2019]|uniref:hypothetical protein n=1 Tax=Sporolactobacillus sp. CQH2019 TaxID=3023512 RepID=UPI002368B96D|nr:hypothetical protein [Sporolactobacillus sp. CQH2019]MDD9147122.1 hypothetical protein [Sporolactobacillus sp. CQH2019]
MVRLPGISMRLLPDSVRLSPVSVRLKPDSVRLFGGSVRLKPDSVRPLLFGASSRLFGASIARFGATFSRFGASETGFGAAADKLLNCLPRLIQSIGYNLLFRSFALINCSPSDFLPVNILHFTKGKRRFIDDTPSFSDDLQEYAKKTGVSAM